MSVVLQKRTLAAWAAENPVIADGEPVYEEDTFKLKVGDGETHYNDLPFAWLVRELSEVVTAESILAARPDLAPTALNAAFQLSDEVVYNAKRHGIFGNGIADDRLAINALIQTVHAAGGGTIYFPPGTYRITTDWINLRGVRKVSIRGAGMGRTIFVQETNGVGFFDTNPGGNDHFSIEGITLSGSAGQNPNGANAINIAACHHFKVVDVEITSWGVSAAGGVVINRISYDGLVTGCIIHDAVTDGFHVNDGSYNITFSLNTVNSCGDEAFTCTSDGAAGAPANIKFSNNTVKNAGTHAFGVHGGTNISIVGNVIDGTYLSAIYCSTAGSAYHNADLTNLLIASNVIRSAGMYHGPVQYPEAAFGIYVGPESGVNTTQRINGVVISGNLLSNGTRNAYLIVGNTFIANDIVTDCNITGNVFSGGTVAGDSYFATDGQGGKGVIVYQAESLRMVGNSIHGALGAAVWINKIQYDLIFVANSLRDNNTGGSAGAIGVQLGTITTAILTANAIINSIATLAYAFGITGVVTNLTFTANDQAGLSNYQLTPTSSAANLWLALQTFRAGISAGNAKATNARTPSGSVPAGMGTGATIVVQGSDMAGFVQPVSGSGSVSGYTVCTVTFQTPLAADPSAVVLTSVGRHKFDLAGFDRFGFTVELSDVNVAISSGYSFTYLVVQ